MTGRINQIQPGINKGNEVTYLSKLVKHIVEHFDYQKEGSTGLFSCDSNGNSIGVIILSQHKLWYLPWSLQKIVNS